MQRRRSAATAAGAAATARRAADQLQKKCSQECETGKVTFGRIHSASMGGWACRPRDTFAAVIGFWVLSPVSGQLSNLQRAPKRAHFSISKIVRIFFGEFTYEVDSQIYKDYRMSLELQHNKDFVVKANSEVERYQPVGTIGMTGATIHPHIHLLVQPQLDEDRLEEEPTSADIFRDLYTRNSVGYWTKDNDPICIPAKYLDPE